jgi:hypothetical protein
MVRISRDSPLAELVEIVKATPPTRGVRAEFVRSVQQSLRVEGYVLSEAEVRRAVENVLHVST